MSSRRARRARAKARPSVPVELTPRDQWDSADAEAITAAVVEAAGEPDPVVTRPPAAPGAEVVPVAESNRLTRELAEALAKVPACTHCGGRHARACPRVKRMSFHRDGGLAEVEFWPSGKWDDTHIVWPEALAEAE